MARVMLRGSSDWRSKTAICLRTAVLGDGEIVAGEAADDGAGLVGHVDEDVDQLGLDVEGGRPGRGGWSTERTESSRKQTQRAIGRILRAAKPTVRRILRTGQGHLRPPRQGLRGNGSPSAHTAPSTKVSFFQMGTVFLRVSMSQRQAS